MGSRFGGVFQLGTPKPDTIFEAAHEAYVELGFQTPHDLTKSAFMTGVAEPLLPGESRLPIG